MISEGSIYPVLLRLKREGLVETTKKQVPSGGPKRKYYRLTEQGFEELEIFKEKWTVISNGVNQLMKGD